MENLKSRTLRVIMAVIALSLPFFAAYAVTPTADKVLADAAARIAKTSGVKASFSLQAGGHTVNGTVCGAGKKFAFTSSAASSWYNGKTLYTYNAASGETTIVTPSAYELAESNPLSIIASAPAHYNAKYASKQTEGTTTLILTPKAKRTGIAKAVLVLGTNYVPKKLDITTDSGERLVLTVNSVKYGVTFPAANFEYPKSRYPNAKIVDLR